MFLRKFRDPSEHLVIAEIAQNHDGSLGTCHAYIDAVAEAGADAIKFQTHIASEESTLDEPFRVRFSLQDETRFDYWSRMEFTMEQWVGLKEHCGDRGIEFLSTPFSVTAVEMLDRLNLPVWKVGSGDTLSPQLFDALVKTGKPVIVSTGMSGWREINAVVELLAESGTEYMLMQCTSMYPTPFDSVGLNVLDEINKRYGCRVGLSDHTGSVVPAMAAIARGFNVVELHVAFDRRMFGPDIAASITIDQLQSLTDFARNVQKMDASPVDKDAMAVKLRTQKELFARSIALRQNLPAGRVLVAEDFVLKKPGGGIPWSEVAQLTGRRLCRPVDSNRLLRREDLEE